MVRLEIFFFSLRRDTYGFDHTVGLESEDSSDEVIGGSGRPLTARQAVLASGVDPAHVTLSAYILQYIYQRNRLCLYPSLK